MLKILNKRERTILYLTLSVIVSAVSFNFLIAPVLTKNNNLNKRISLTRAKLKKYLWLLSQKDNIQSKYSKFFSTPDVSNRQEDTLVSVLSELEALAKGANIRIIDIRPQTPSRGDMSLYKVIVVDLRTEGVMKDYLEFIYAVENSLSLLRIKRFQLTSKPNAQALEGNFSISKLSEIK